MEIIASAMNPRGNRVKCPGFSLIEVLMALAILSGAFVAITGIFPISALIHRLALERGISMALAQHQMEYFLSSPGPAVGEQGATANFVNAGRFPPGYTGFYSATSFAAGGGLTLIVVRVTPPHAPKVEISAIDTTYSNFTP